MIEIDLEYVLFEIPQNLKSYVEDLQGKKIRFLDLRVSYNFLESVHKLGWKTEDKKLLSSLPKVAPNWYLLPFRLKEISLDKLRFRDSDQMIEVIFAYVLKKKVHWRLTFSNIKQGIKSSVKFDGFVNIENMPWVALSGDTVRLIRLKWKSKKRSCRDNGNLIEELIKKIFIMTR